jgi:tripartite-type tricarboxylate transporter receptor subunit TctC
VKTPRAIVARVTAAHDNVIARAEYGERLAGLAMEPLVLTREQTSAFIKAEIEKWRKVATAANVRID